MKKWTVAKWSLALAMLPFVGGCMQDSASSAPTIVTATNQTTNAASTPAVTNVPAPEVAEQELENAPGKIVSVAQPPAQNAELTMPAAEVAKLAQSGVDENVQLAFVTNSPNTFNLGSDQIIYLNDIGVPGNVVTAMIQHDQSLKMVGDAQPASPVYANPPVAGTPVAPAALEYQPPPVVTESAPPPQVNVTYSYFNDSLAPYGNWIEIEGYGRCWQPSVVVADRGWTPYCNRGHWVYSDCGWYWASDYSWGWAPFHYGRWFRHNFWGWCWAPDTVWGPSWVSWRSSPGYCGWAPLPPTACYRPGFGFTYYGRAVGVGFNFGLGVDFFTFVPASHFCDARPYYHRVPRNNVTQIFNNTIVINPVIEERGNSRFHKGIPVNRIAEATHTEIKPVRIYETTGPSGNDRHERFDRNNDSLTVYRPRLPEPPALNNGHRVGEGTPLASPRQKDTPPNNSMENARILPPSGNRQPHQVRETENNPPAPNNRQTPLNSLIAKGRPENSAQATAPATPVTGPRIPVQNNLLVNRRQFAAPQPSTETPGASQQNLNQRNPQILRQETSRIQPPAERVISRPIPVQRQPEARIYQPVPLKSPREQSAFIDSVPQQSAPTARSEPVVPVMPRVEARPAPSAPVSRPALQNGNKGRDNR